MLFLFLAIDIFLSILISIFGIIIGDMVLAPLGFPYTDPTQIFCIAAIPWMADPGEAV